MKLLSVKIGNATDVGWQFPVVHFKKLNLLVGESASGKSTFLNFLFNIGMKVSQDQGAILGVIRVEFEQDGTRYAWELECRKAENEPPEIFSESLWSHPSNSPPVQLLDRRDGSITVKGEKVPRMSPKSTGIYLFREDADIKPAHKAFTRLMRRDFAAGELNNAFGLQALRKDLFEKCEKTNTVEALWDSGIVTLNPRLFLLERYFPEKYEAVCASYKNVFPFVERFEFKDMSEAEIGVGFRGRMPLLHIKDRKINELIGIQDLSSGMKKTLVIIADILALPAGTVYLIDEYENSLGMNAINFLPTLLAEYGDEKQFIVTSHHPYMINAIPVDNWVVFHRDGLNVSVKQGDQLVESYGKSKQQAFVKLLNDPFYTDGQ